MLPPGATLDSGGLLDSDIAVGDVTSADIDLSKANVFFGIRAVDRAGLHSPVAFPVPRLVTTSAP